MTHAANQTFTTLVQKIVADPILHAKWLNTLSMMENTGARKISHYEHPVHTGIIVLKHAAEEARHAYYLKKLIAKTGTYQCPDYSFEYLLAPVDSYHYLHALDVAACRYVKKELKMEGRDMMHGAYLLVTYAIEVRADELYGAYQEILTHANSKVNVKTIIAEEEGHLAEMTNMLTTFHPEWRKIAEDVCKIEGALFNNWIQRLEKNI